MSGLCCSSCIEFICMLLHIVNYCVCCVLQENLHVRCLVLASFSCAGDIVYVALT